MSTPDETAELLTLRKIHCNDGSIRYINNRNELHRINGPAVIFKNGEKRWIQNGVLHREDGPAVLYPDGRGLWFLHGELLPVKTCRVINAS